MSVKTDISQLKVELKTEVTKKVFCFLFFCYIELIWYAPAEEQFIL